MRNLQITLACLLFLFVGLHCSKKDPETEAPILTITCPKDTIILAGENYYAIYKAPEPVLFTNCKQGGLQLTTLSGGVENSYFPLGTTTIAYQATDACGLMASCAYKVTVQKNGPITYCDGIPGIPNFRKALVGLYAGLGSIGANPPSPTTVPICYDPDTPDHVLVSGDAVLLDSLCFCYPGQAFGNYRSYSLRFTGDSIFLSGQLNGPLSHPEPVYTFRGKKIR